MKVVIDNLGVVKHATIDLNKNIILFCGPNNSGKTYIAYVLNALFSQSRIFRSVMNNVVMKDQNGTTYTITENAKENTEKDEKSSKENQES